MIAPEVGQPLSTIVTNGEAYLRWLCRQPPNMAEIEGCVSRMTDEGNRAAQIVQRVRTLIKGASPDRVDPEGNVVVAVKDSGAGIREDNLPRLFEPLFTTRSSGIGMGLAISSSILEAHGGQIWASNNPEGGATFSFSLPPGMTQGVVRT
ncbi:sensor histidine kinase [Caballeronia udeis]|uniref:sensor histidine kinase n=1 Tax=Caballeronia udeis TaxID=1232866 RepID=UPI001E53B916|nr:ATP-binding protein [Caballeronia udeis]